MAKGGHECRQTLLRLQFEETCEAFPPGLGLPEEQRQLSCQLLAKHPDIGEAMHLLRTRYLLVELQVEH